MLHIVIMLSYILPIEEFNSKTTCMARAHKLVYIYIYAEEITKLA